jgi:plasmid stabilization system protein ParE
VRVRALHRWLVFYDPTDSPLTILRVIHGAREIDRLLED